MTAMAAMTHTVLSIILKVVCPTYRTDGAASMSMSMGIVCHSCFTQE